MNKKAVHHVHSALGYVMMLRELPLHNNWKVDNGSRTNASGVVNEKNFSYRSMHVTLGKIGIW